MGKRDIKVKDENGNEIESNYMSVSVSAHNGKVTGLYKFKPAQNIPNKIFIEYKDAETEINKDMELNLI